MAKKKIDVLGIVLIAIAVVGVILAVVGIAIPWFATQGKSVLGDKTETYGLFADFGKSDFPIAAVQAFAIISLVLAVVACAVRALNTFGVVKINWLIRVILAGLTVVCAILTLVFAIVFAGQDGGLSMGSLLNVQFVASAGSYLLPIGAIVASIPLVFNRK